MSDDPLEWGLKSMHGQASRTAGQGTETHWYLVTPPPLPQEVLPADMPALSAEEAAARQRAWEEQEKERA